jgi:hypothetical protein
LLFSNGQITGIVGGAVINSAEMQDSGLKPRHIHKCDTEVEKARDRGKDFFLGDASLPLGNDQPVDDLINHQGGGRQFKLAPDKPIQHIQGTFAVFLVLQEPLEDHTGVDHELGHGFLSNCFLDAR